MSRIKLLLDVVSDMRSLADSIQAVCDALASDELAETSRAETPSARLEQEFDDNESEAAKEGTAAHALCEHKLKKALRMRSRCPVSDYDSDEMEECSDAYVDFIMEQVEEAKQHCKDPIVRTSLERARMRR